MRLIGIFGTGGLAREAGDIVAALRDTAFYVARDADEKAAWQHEDDVILESDIASHSMHDFVIAIGDGAIRSAVAERFCELLRFVNLIHPDTSFGRGQRARVEAQQGNIIMAGARLSNTIAIGDFVIINPNATIGHDAIIEDFATICPGAIVSGNVRIGTGAWVGAGAVINQGTAARPLEIGASALIGSGAVVTGDCHPGGVYAGVPARKIR